MTYPSGHTPEDIQTLFNRMARAEARQRAYGMHDPDCPVFQHQRDQARTDLYLTPPGHGGLYGPCGCWLADQSTEPSN